MFKQTLILVFFTQLFGNSLVGQLNIPNTPIDSIRYDLFVDEKVIGDFWLVKRFTPDSIIEYTAQSNVDYKILFSFHISFNYFTSFSLDGNLMKSEFFYLLNDDIKEENWINCIGNKCYIYEGNQVKKIIDNSINLTGVQLFFAEPIYDTHVFSERYCDHFKVEMEKQKEGDVIYKVDFPGGSTNRYHYRNGICYKVEISSIFTEMEFRRKGY